MASVEIGSVKKYYGDIEVLHGVSIDIADGEFVVLVGPSGCGKSTLLRMIAGLEEISEGDILINGLLVNDLPPKKRNLAMVFQSYALYPHMTVAENMGFSLRLAKQPKKLIDQEVRRAAEILDLQAYLDRYPRHLSGGQRQRVAMGRAIVRNPKVFLFDEPLSNLDAKLRGQMRAELKSLHQRLGTTTIYVTHDQTEAMTLADRMVVMKDGNVEQIGSPMDVFRNPANQFVAGFIGSPPMNFIAGKATEEGISVGDGEMIATDGVGRTTSDRPVYLGVRPKHLLVGSSAGPVNFPFHVELVEPTGDEVELTGRLFGQRVTAITPAMYVRSGETVPVALPPQSLFLFDRVSGERIAPL
ncbi:MAG TPA: sn-glycerol-3-phosphate ABC transporter ATP-binding protein UgpC [Devosiaceae bacterium]|jgi:multiple sugar transport system ATP-binding protein|nr:sn-glycerol-3-phosphate ABC transporter ATP-binding protein UgpC [Devosiaceae bacterium]